MGMNWKWAIPYEEFVIHLSILENSNNGLQEPILSGITPCSFLHDHKSPTILPFPHFAPATLAFLTFLKRAKDSPALESVH